MLIQVTSYKPGATALTLVDGATVTGYVLLDEANWGNVVWENAYSGARGTQGARAAGGVPQNRPVVLPFRVTGSSKDDLFTKLSALQVVAEDLRRFGGRITWRAKDETYRQHFEVMAGSSRLEDWRRRSEFSNIADVIFEAVCAPYLLGDPMDILDSFDADTAADYTIDASAGAAGVVAGGQLALAASSSARWRHTARGYTMRDAQVTLRIPPLGTWVNATLRVFLGSNGGSAANSVRIDAELNSAALLIRYMDGTTATTLATSAFAPDPTARYWLRLRREGRKLTAILFNPEPTPSESVHLVVVLSATLTTDQAGVVGNGHAGLEWNVASAGAIEEFLVAPFTFVALTLPDARALTGKIPGDAAALAELTVTPFGGAAAPISALLAWWPQAPVWNACWNGDFEDDVNGWSVAGVAGVTGAATSIARTIAPPGTKYGVANAEIVCPATANTGAVFPIYRRFFKGRSYLVVMWVSSPAQTTPMRVRFGVSGDIASGFTANVGTAVSPRFMLWSPAADVDVAYAAVEITAATATTFNIDGVCILEALPARLAAGITNLATSLTVNQVPIDWPATPFLAAIMNAALTGLEIVTVSNIVGTTLTITRAQEGTSGTTWSTADLICPLPLPRPQFEGKGAPPPAGLIEAESADSGNLYTWAITPDAGARIGNKLYASGIGAAGSVSADWLVDPHLLLPDDYVQGELAVEVWGRVALHAGLTLPKAIPAAAPETATIAAGVFSSSYGQVRYSEEYGTIGKSLVKPSAGEVWRFCRLGTLRFPVDRAHPNRWRLQLRLTWTAAAAAAVGLDYLVLCPAGARALSPTGKANDANYPKFVGSTAETVKTIRSDLSGYVAKPGSEPHPDHGLGGRLLELPPGDVEALVKLSSLVPDDPTSDTTSEQEEHTATVHFAVTPRYILARGS